MSTKVAVKFQAIHNLTSSTCRNIVRYLTYKQTCHVRRVDKAVVFWVENLGQSAPEGMLSQSQELKVVGKGKKSIDTEITHIIFGKCHRIFPWLGVKSWRRWPFCFNCLDI
jgi:hypothetical protein